MAAIFGIDLGGTKIEGVVLKDALQPTPIARLRIPTEGHLGYERIIENLKKLVQALEKESGFTAERIGIGTPGTVDPKTGLHKNSNTTCLNGKSFKADVALALGIPVEMANDANCFGLAEAMLGAAAAHLHRSEKIVFGVIMGTGVGGGLVVNGKVIGGAQGIGGEWGHNFLDESGGPCYCGKTGCIETIISGPALERYYQHISGKALSLKDIYARHLSQTDGDATMTMERLIHYFGKAISSIINVVDPDVIVIGGGVGNIDLLYEEGVEEVRKHVFNPVLDTVFLKPALGDSAGVFGAAILVS